VLGGLLSVPKEATSDEANARSRVRGRLFVPKEATSDEANARSRVRGPPLCA